MSVLKMTVADWLKVEDNPIQRDTERHAARAKHLLKPLPVHAIVWAGKLPSGALIKLDGHTRAYMWGHNMVDAPKQIEVHLIDVKDRAEAASLYKTFDSKDALETTQDKISGALRGLNFKPQSALIASGNYSTSLRLAWSAVYGYSRDTRAKDIYEEVNEFAVEVLALDDFLLRKGQLSSPAMAAFFISVRKYSDKILPFWKAVIANGGTKSRGRMDGVQAAMEILLSMKAKRGYGGTAIYDQTSRLLACADKWVKGEDMASVPRPVEFTTYLDSTRHQPKKFRLIRGKGKRPQAQNGVAATEAAQ